MVYKNFFLRLFISLIFIIIYLICLSINFSFVFYIILLIYSFIFIEIYINFKKYKLLPYLYLIISFIFFINIDFNQEIFFHFNLFILIIVMFDIFSYIVGNAYGKIKIFKISPNKTLEGLIGGTIISFVIGLIFSHFVGIFINIQLVIYTIMIIICSFIGDILESYFKRKNNLKNSSEFIPGHGGVFDRFDSFLFSIIFYSISINI